MESNIKRTEDNIMSWVLLISFLISLVLGVLSIVFSWFTKIGDTTILSVIILSLGFIASMFLFHSQNIRVVEIYTFSYEHLNAVTDEYELRYNFFQIELVANFILTFRLKDTLKSLTKEEIESILKNNYEHNDGYKTKGAMLIEIKGYIESIMKSQNVSTLPKIKGVTFMDTLDVEEEIEKIKTNRENIKNK